MNGTVAWIHVAPIKGLQIQERTEVVLTRLGVPGDRAFCIVDEAGRMLNAKRALRFVAVRPHLDDEMRHLSLTLPDGRVVEGDVAPSEAMEIGFFSRRASVHLVPGPWDEALSGLAGERVRLARLDEVGAGTDRGNRGGAATLLSLASLDALAEAAVVEAPIDPRRFRMLFGIAGVAAHEEDGWIGREVRVGEAVVVPSGNVGRCVVTTLDPESGASDLDTLDALARYRGAVRTTEALPFGVWARVATPGRVRVGDHVSV